MARDSGYDILINNRGYMLARAAQLGRGGRAWQSRSAGAGTARLTPTETAWGNQPSVIEAPMVWRTTHLGYGAERQRVEGRYNYSIDIDARFAEQVLPGPALGVLTDSDPQSPAALTETCKGFFEQDDMVFAVGGRYALYIKSDNSFGLAKDFGAGEAGMACALFDGEAYVGMGYAEPFWERAAGNADATVGWLQAGAGLYMGYMSAFKDRLWASVKAYQVQCVATAPRTAANWGGLYKIGDPGESITAVAELASLLYIGKADGLHALGSSGLAQNLTPELRPYKDASNCAQMKAWHASLWVPHVRGFLNYQNLGNQGFLVVPATPGYDSGEDNPIRGTVTAMAGDNRWLYAALYTFGGDTYILAGREAEGDERALGRMIWHPLMYLESIHVEAMHLSGLWTNPRLFFGIAAGKIGYIVLPRYTDNPLHDANCRYKLSGSIYYPAHTWNVPTTRKVWKSLEVEADELVLGRYLEVYFRVDRTPPWVYLGRLIISPYHILVFPEDTVGKEIEVRIDYVMPNAITPFVLRTLLVRATERPRAVELIRVVIRCADELPLRTSGHCPRDGATLLAELRAVARQTESVSLIDPIGTGRTVLVLDPVGEQESQQEGKMPREMLAVVNMVTFEAEATAEDWVFGKYGTSTYGGGHVYY